MIDIPFQKLLIWQKGMKLAKKAYICTNSFPKSEQFGLTSQIRRCAVSVPSNIAEGSQRTSKKEFAHFCLIAKGSLAELQTQSILALEFKYITQIQFNDLKGLIIELDKMIYSFYTKLK